MKHLKMQDCSIKTVYSGVYKITFPNNKIYIGISNHIYRRMLEHNTDFRNNLPIEHAIQKYGKIIEFDILEEISPEERDFMRSREQYWIKKYKSNQKEFGYNISSGGDGAGIGSNNLQAKFSEEQIQLLYQDLKTSSLSLEELAKKYQVHISTISNINNGHTYFHTTENYPIRTINPSNSGVKNHNSKFSQEDLNKIYDLLINHPEISMKKIGEQFNVWGSTIQNINLGKTYYNKNYTYPLREPKTGKRKYSDIQIQEIIQIIKNNPNKSLAQIGRELNISSKTMSGINLGTIYKQANQKYPIR